MPGYLKGLRGADLVVGLLLLPILIPLWIIFGILTLADAIQEWWWNS